MATVVLVVVLSTFISIWLAAIAASRLSPNNAFVQKYLNPLVPKAWRGIPTSSASGTPAPSDMVFPSPVSS